MNSSTRARTKRLSPLSFLVLLTALAVVAIDQGLKYAVEAKLPLGGWIDILPVLALDHVHNTGLVLSAFADTGFGLIIVPLAATLIVIIFWARTSDAKRTTAAAFGLILGGAIGNLIDRALLGYGIDFLLVHIGDLVLFVFNFADVAVVSGLLLLVSNAAIRKRQAA